MSEKEGWMWKRGKRKTDAFLKRYFVLRSCWLSYFGSPNSSQPKGAVPLRGATLRLDPDEMHGFTVLTVSGRTFYIKCADAKQLGEWYAVLNRSIESGTDKSKFDNDFRSGSTTPSSFGTPTKLTMTTIAPKPKPSSLEARTAQRRLRRSQSVSGITARLSRNSDNMRIGGSSGGAVGGMNVKPQKLFGTDLSVVMGLEADSPFDVPVIVHQAIEYLEANALKTRGIYRMSGSVAEVKQLRTLYESGAEIAWEGCDDHSVAGLLKLYLRELPDPPIPHNQYDNFLKAGKCQSPSFRLSEYRRLFRACPLHHQNLLRRVTQHLRKVSNYNEINCMTVSNLAIVFAPNLFRANIAKPTNAQNKFADPGALVAMRDAPSLLAVTKTLIDEQDFIMGADVPTESFGDELQELPSNSPLALALAGNQNDRGMRRGQYASNDSTSSRRKRTFKMSIEVMSQRQSVRASRSNTLNRISAPPGGSRRGTDSTVLVEPSASTPVPSDSAVDQWIDEERSSRTVEDRRERRLEIEVAVQLAAVYLGAKVESVAGASDDVPLSDHIGLRRLAELLDTSPNVSVVENVDLPGSKTQLIGRVSPPTSATNSLSSSSAGGGGGGDKKAESLFSQIDLLLGDVEKDLARLSDRDSRGSVT